MASLRTLYEKFRPTVWFRLTYLVLLGVIVAQLYVLTLSPLACIAFLLMPIVTFLVPYWLGERQMRRFAANALLVFAIAIFLASAMSTQAVLSQTEPLELESFTALTMGNMTLANGRVEPFQSAPGDAFTFRVKLTTEANASADDFDVFLNLSVIDGLSARAESFPMDYSEGTDSSLNPRNGTWYETRMPLGASIYLYQYSVTDRRANWTHTFRDVGPITAPATAFYVVFVYESSFNLVIPLLFYFSILFLWWYTVRSRQIRGRMTARSPEATKDRAEPAPPPSEGKASKAAAFTCTNCGADVSASDDKCPKCGAVFED